MVHFPALHQSWASSLSFHKQKASPLQRVYNSERKREKVCGGGGHQECSLSCSSQGCIDNYVFQNCTLSILHVDCSQGYSGMWKAEPVSADLPFYLAQLALDRHGSQLLTSAHYILGISLTCFPCTPSDSKEQEKAGHGVAGSALLREHN